MAGLIWGLLGHGWGESTVGQAALFGAGFAVLAWFLPGRARGVSEDLWDALSRSEKRAVLEALGRGDRVASSVSPWLADEIRRTYSPRRGGTPCSAGCGSQRWPH